jgi:hypothetical protein
VANLTGGGIEIKFLLAAVGLAAVGLMSFVGNAIMDKKEA